MALEDKANRHLKPRRRDSQNAEDLNSPRTRQETADAATVGSTEDTADCEAKAIAPGYFKAYGAAESTSLPDDVDEDDLDEHELETKVVTEEYDEFLAKNFGHQMSPAAFRRKKIVAKIQTLFSATYAIDKKVTLQRLITRFPDLTKGWANSLFEKIKSNHLIQRFTYLPNSQKLIAIVPWIVAILFVSISIVFTASKEEKPLPENNLLAASTLPEKRLTSPGNPGDNEPPIAAEPPQKASQPVDQNPPGETPDCNFLSETDKIKDNYKLGALLYYDGDRGKTAEGDKLNKKARIARLKCALAHFDKVVSGNQRQSNKGANAWFLKARSEYLLAKFKDQRAHHAKLAIESYRQYKLILKRPPKLKRKTMTRNLKKLRKWN